jgi:hypothetical protein
MEMHRPTKKFPFGDSPLPNRVCAHLGINIYVNIPNGALLVIFLMKFWIYLIDIYILGSHYLKTKKSNKLFLTVLSVPPLLEGDIEINWKANITIIVR